MFTLSQVGITAGTMHFQYNYFYPAGKNCSKVFLNCCSFRKEKVSKPVFFIFQAELSESDTLHNLLTAYNELVRNHIVVREKLQNTCVLAISFS